MPEYNEVTGKFELTKKEKQYMERKRKATFAVPDRYNSTRWDIKPDPAPFNQQPGRIEVNVEGEEEVTLRETPLPEALPEPTGKPEWRIDELICLKNGAGFKVRATETLSGKQCVVGFEPYYDTYLAARADVQAVGKLLLKTYKERGIEVTTKQQVFSHDLMEEMYQLLSIMMTDPNIAEKYDSSWQTVKTQFDNSL